MPAARIVLAVLCAGLLGLGGCGRGNGQHTMPDPEVGVVTVKSGRVTLTAELPGRTVPYAISDVRPQVSGIIVQRTFAEGAEVKAGETLYIIDPKSYRAAYDNARAALTSALANAKTNRAKAERYATLLKENAIAPQTYDDTKAAAEQASAAVSQAKATLETARINLNYTRVTAPISGRIGISTVTQGALVTADQTTALTTIQTLDPIYVDIAQSSSQLLQLKRAIASGQMDPSKPVVADVTLRLDDNSVYPLKGKLQVSDVTVDTSTGTVTLRAIFPNPNHLLLPGMFVRAEVAEGIDPHAILAPQQGVIRDPKGVPTALVVGKNNKVEMRTLQIGRSVGNQWLVTAGLHAGDRLIVQGTMRALPGIAVKPVPVALEKFDPYGAPASEPAGGDGGGL